MLILNLFLLTVAEIIHENKKGSKNDDPTAFGYLLRKFI